MRRNSPFGGVRGEEKINFKNLGKKKNLSSPLPPKAAAKLIPPETVGTSSPKGEI
jgi:hypothetical protein